MSVAAVILLVLEVPLWLVYARHENDVAGAGVVHDATALASLADEVLEHDSTADLGRVANSYRSAVKGDVEIIDRAGAVIVPPRPGDIEMSQPEVRAQLLAVVHGNAGGIRTIAHLDDIVAFEPVGSVDQPTGAVVVATSDAVVDQHVHDAGLALEGLAVGVLTAVALLGLLVAESVTKPLTQLENAARRLGQGDLEARAPTNAGPTEVRAVSREFNAMARRLDELIAAQRGFVADASHQLRSPLTALRLRLENSAAAAPDADSDAVLAELDRLSRVVDGLLALARSEGQRPDRSPIDVTAVVADRCDTWSALAEEAGVALEAVLPDETPVVVWLVAGHLEQIVDNLLANALEATPAGRSVYLSVVADTGRVEVHVTDEGKGMGTEERRHAFDRFWRGSTSRTGAGSGLGLSIVRQLAEANEADVELREAPSGGIDAVMTMTAGRPSDIRSPRRAPADPSAASAASAGASSASASSEAVRP